MLLCTSPISFWGTSGSLFGNTVQYFDSFVCICIIICLLLGFDLYIAPYLARVVIMFEEKNSERQPSLTIVIGMNGNKRSLSRKEQELGTICL